MFSKQFTWKDVLLITLAALSLLGTCIIWSAKKLFWNDELYSWYLLSDPSFFHMWEAFHAPINNTPPLYFLLGWIWAQLFSASELSLRLFSALGICVALAVTWWILRRVYSFWPTALGVLLVFFTSTVIYQQTAEARMYGLYLAVAAFTFLLYDRLNTHTGKIPWELLLLNFLAHSALIHTHLHGIFFSGAVLGAFLCSDYLLNGGWRIRIYASIVAGWLTFLLYLPAFLVQSRAGALRAWLPRPSVEDLFSLYSSSDAFINWDWVPVVFTLAAGLWLTTAYAGYTLRSSSDNSRHRTDLLLFAMAMLAVPVLVWLISRTVKPIYYDRYLLPALIGFCIILTHSIEMLILPLSQKANRRSPSSFRVWSYLQVGFTIVTGLFCLVLISSPLYSAATLPERPSFLVELKTTVDERYQSLPVVCQISHDFIMRMYYSKNPERYFFILHKEAAMTPASGQFGPQEYHHLKAFKQHFPDRFDKQVLESEQFLNQFDEFLIYDEENFDKPCPERVFEGLVKARKWEDLHCPQWLEMRLLPDPTYEIRPLKTQWERTLIHVKKKTL